MDKRRETKLKQLLFQSQHRGFAELDLLLGDFARKKLATLPEAQLNAYEAILKLQDWDVYNWLVGQAAPPAEHAAIITLIQENLNER